MRIDDGYRVGGVLRRDRRRHAGHDLRFELQHVANQSDGDVRLIGRDRDIALLVPDPPGIDADRAGRDPQVELPTVVGDRTQRRPDHRDRRAGDRRVAIRIHDPPIDLPLLRPRRRRGDRQSADETERSTHGSSRRPGHHSHYV